MILFFKGANQVFALATKETISQENCEKLQWLFGSAKQINSEAASEAIIGISHQRMQSSSKKAVLVGPTDPGSYRLMVKTAFENIHDTDAEWQLLMPLKASNLQLVQGDSN